MRQPVAAYREARGLPSAGVLAQALKAKSCMRCHKKSYVQPHGNEDFRTKVNRAIGKSRPPQNNQVMSNQLRRFKTSEAQEWYHEVTMHEGREGVPQRNQEAAHWHQKGASQQCRRAIQPGGYVRGRPRSSPERPEGPDVLSKGS